jgi:hypothetical protein
LKHESLEFAFWELEAKGQYYWIDVYVLEAWEEEEMVRERW